MLYEFRQASVLTFSTLVVGIGELGLEWEPRPSGTSAKTSSSFSDADASNEYVNNSERDADSGQAKAHLDHEPRGLRALRSCEEVVG